MKARKHLNFTHMRNQLSAFFKHLPDNRQLAKVTINLHDVLMSAFACMYFQDPSLLQFQRRMQEAEHRNNLKTLFDVENIPKDTQMRDIIDGVDSELLRPLFKEYYLLLQRGKELNSYELFPNQYLVPMDGTEYFSSKKINCEHCLNKEHEENKLTYSHHVLQGGIMHPDQAVVIPLMPEEIRNEDGHTKQDCEMNAAKRFVKKVRRDHPQLGLIFGGDSLFSKQPLIEEVLAKRAHYIFGAKPKDHVYLMDWLATYPQLHQIEFIDKKNNKTVYEWMNDVPLHGGEESLRVNFFCCKVFSPDLRLLYQNSWVTDITINAITIHTLVRAGRCRWKAENECFNVLKNHGYCIDHNYGHGTRHLGFNFYLLTLLAFFFHQIFEATDPLYQRVRQKLGSKRHLWETLRAYLKIIIFTNWEFLLEFTLQPKRYTLVPTQAP